MVGPVSNRPAFRAGWKPAHRCLLFLGLIRDFLNDLVHQTKLLGFLSREEAVALGLNGDLVDLPAGVFGQNLVESPAVLS